MSEDDDSRSTLFDERREHLKKRKTWITNLCIHTSDEDNLDEPRLDNKIDTSQLIALRFPYPMISDDSDDEDDLNYFPNDLKTSVGLSTDKKRKRTSSSDELPNRPCKNTKNTIVGESKNHGKINRLVDIDGRTIFQNRRKSTSPLSNNKQFKHNDSHTSTNSSSDSSNKTHKFHKKRRKREHNKTEDLSKITSSVNATTKNIPESSYQKKFRCKHTDNLPNYESITSHNRTTVVKSPEVGKSNNVLDQEVWDESDLNETARKSRFLDSSSNDNTDEEENNLFVKKTYLKTKSKSNGNSSFRYRRIHVLSSSSSDSDGSKINKTQNDSKSSSNLTINRSIQSKSRNKRSSHFISSSSEEDSDEDHFTTTNNNRNELVLQKSSKDVHPCYNSINTFNITETQKPENNDKEVENYVQQIDSKLTTVSKTPNLNSTSWKKIAAMPIRKQTIPSNPINKGKINDLKKKFVSSNVSSVEIRKKIQNVTLGKIKSSKPSSSGIKSLKNKKSSDPLSNSKVRCSTNLTRVKDNSVLNDIRNTVQKNGDRREQLENNYTVNVNVYCGSPQSSGIENNLSPNNQNVCTAGETLIASEKSNLDINLVMHEAKDDMAVSEHSKKLRISRFSQGNNRSQHQNKASICTTNPLDIKKSFLDSDKSHETKDSVIKDNSNQCDVLGSILSEMEKNPYKIEKPVKKGAATKADDLGWFPNPLVFGSINQSYSKETNLSFKTQGDLPHLSYNKNNLIEPSTNTLNNSYLHSPSKVACMANNCASPNNTKTQKICPGSQETRGSVIVTFYSADSHEYVSKSTENVDLGQEAQKRLKEQSPNKSSTNKNTSKSTGNVDLSQEAQTSLNDGEICRTQSPNIKFSTNKNTSKSTGKVDLSQEAQTSLKDGDLCRTQIPNIKISTNKNTSKSVEKVDLNQKAQTSLKDVELSRTQSPNIKISTNKNTSKCIEKVNLSQKAQTSLKDGELSRTQSPNIKISTNKSTSKSVQKVYLSQKAQTSLKDGELRRTQSPNIKISTNENTSQSAEKDDFSQEAQKSLKEDKLRSIQNPNVKVSTNKNYKQGSLCKKTLNSKLISNNKSKKYADFVNQNDVTGSFVEKQVKLTTNTKSMPGTSKRAARKTDTQLANNTSDNGNAKGIRIKLGGTIFRLPGKINPSILSNSPDKAKSTTSIVNEKSVTSSSNDELKINSDTSNSNTLCKPIFNSAAVPPDSEDTDTSSDSSSDSEESSSDSSDSSESTNRQEGKCPSKEVTTGSSDQKCSTEKDIPLLNQTTGGPDNSTVLSGVIDETNKNQSNNNLIDVIVLSDSSDSENVTKNNDTPQHNVTNKIEDRKNATAADYNNDTSTNFVGKIRVRSLRDLGVDVRKPLPENALPTVPSVLSPVVSSNQADVQVKQPSLGITKTPPVYETNQTQLNPTISLHVGSKDQSNTDIGSSTQNVVFVQPSKSPALNNSISTITQSKDNLRQVDNSNTATSILSNGANNELQIQQTVPNQTKENHSSHITTTVEAQTMFFDLCDTLFTDLFHFKIPKLVDDLYLAIIDDKSKEDRIKKLDQFLTPLTVASEKRRSEKEFADKMKIRGQSFVPLFMTIVNKIAKQDFTTLVIALYCRIVQQLVRIDPENAYYRIKLREIIKYMLQKHSSPGVENVISVLSSDQSIFISHFNFVENLLLKYDTILEQRQLQAQLQEKETNNTPSSNSKTNVENLNTTEIVDKTVGSNPPELPNNAPTCAPVRLEPVPKASSGTLYLTVLKQIAPKPDQVKLPVSDKNHHSSTSSSNDVPSTNSTSSTPVPINPLIGNLDSLFFKKTSVSKNNVSR